MWFIAYFPKELLTDSLDHDIRATELLVKHKELLREAHEIKKRKDI